MNEFIIGIDIGGTTYSSALFDGNFDLVKASEKNLISDINSTDHFLKKISKQITGMIDKNFIGNVLGVGVSCPGPLDSKKGIVLDTPNLSFLQNIKLKEELEERCNLPVFIENDANLFALGEWFLSGANHKEIFGALTLGTGLGFGIIINGKIYTGAHGLAAEYAISPLDSGTWETKVSIKAIKEIAKRHEIKDLEPIDIHKMAIDGDEEASKVWSEFGENLGVVLSHFINMIDPDKISIGGGVSAAYNLFETTMDKTIREHSPAYRNFDINIFESKQKELSSQLGAAFLVKDYNDNK